MIGAILAVQPVTIEGVRFSVHTLLVCGATVLIGFQLVAHSSFCAC